MTKKIIISDLDGTLLRGWFVTMGDRLAVRRFRKKGAFFLATGRDYPAFIAFEKWYRVKFDYGVLSNGAILIDKQQNILFNQTFETRRLLSVMRDKRLEEYMTQLSFTFSFGKWSKEYGKIPWNNRLTIFKKLPDQLTQASIKVDRINLLPELIPILRAEGLSIESNGRYLDILAAGVSKRSGIQALLSLVNFGDFKLHVIGDSTNDLKMFELTDASYGISTGSPEVLEAASFTVSSVAECIKHVLETD